MVPWHSVCFCSSVNDKLDFLTQNITQLFHTHIPPITKRIKKSKPVWFQEEVIIALKYRNKSYNKWKSSPSSRISGYFKQSRNNVHTVTKKKPNVLTTAISLELTSQKRIFGKYRNVGLKKSRV